MHADSSDRDSGQIESVRTGIIGIGGFAEKHRNLVARCQEQGLCELACVVVREEDAAAQADAVAGLRSRGVTIYPACDEMLAAEAGKLDLVTVPCGIDQHEPLSVGALRAGFHVYCEKPVAGTVAEALSMQRARDESDRLLVIGYQNIGGPSIQRIKEITLAGTLGRLLAARSCCASRRDGRYYSRNYWAGRIAVGEKRIYDSPMQNAMSHTLNNMLYVAGPSHHVSGAPVEVYGECYHAQDIESADTQYIRLTTDTGVTIRFIATHAIDGPGRGASQYLYENGRIELRGGHNCQTTVYRYTGAGEEAIEEFNNGDAQANVHLFRNALAAVRGRAEPLCTIDNAMQQTMGIEKLFESSGGVTPVGPPHAVTETATDDSGREYANSYIVGIHDLMTRMYENDLSFAEAGAPWAKPGTVLRLDNSA